MSLTDYFLVASVILVVALAVWLADPAHVLFRYRGKMLFTCPETGKAACVQVAAIDAARSSLMGRPKIHLRQCSRWPERQDCGQECLSQVGADPQNCLVGTRVSNWYRGRACVYCHKPFLDLHWRDHKPALLSPDGKTIECGEVPAEKLPELFETHLPVCWSCHIAETFRRKYPERVVDRPGNRGVMGELVAEQKKDEARTVRHG